MRNNFFIKLIYVLYTLFYLFSFKSIFAVERKLPPRNILNAAFKIIPQTEAQYEVSGDLECFLRRMGTYPPFWADTGCYVHINNQKSAVENHEEIIPYLISSIIFKDWEIVVPFEAYSYKDTNPPYYTKQEVRVQIDFDAFDDLECIFKLCHQK